MHSCIHAFSNFVEHKLLDTCLKKGSRDNMTVLIVKFPAQIIGKGGGVPKRRKRREFLKLEKKMTSGKR